MSGPSTANLADLEEIDGTTRGAMSSLDIAYVVLVFIVSLMSILGGMTVLGVHLAYRDLRTVGKNMLLHLTVADILTAFGNIIGVIWYLSVETQPNVMAFCKIHSALTIMSSIASFIWNVVIAWFVFWIILRMKPSNDHRNKGYCKNIILPIVCWGVPITIASAALIDDVLGYDKKLASASWCWIDPNTDNPFMWMMVTGKAWEMTACFATFFLYTAVRIILFNQARKRKSTLNTNNRKLEEANTKLTFVPLTFITLRIWGTLRFLIGNFAHSYASSSDSDWIALMQGTGDSAQGFANFVIYCFFTRKIRARLLGKCPCAIFHISEYSNGKATSVVSKGAQSVAQPRCSNNKVAPLNTGNEEKLPKNNVRPEVVVQSEHKEVKQAQTTPHLTTGASITDLNSSMTPQAGISLTADAPVSQTRGTASNTNDTSHNENSTGQSMDMDAQNGALLDILSKVSPKIRGEALPKIQRNFLPEFQKGSPLEIQREVLPEKQREVLPEIQTGNLAESHREILPDIQKGTPLQIQSEALPEIQIKDPPEIQALHPSEIQREDLLGIQIEHSSEIQGEDVAEIQEDVRSEVDEEDPRSVQHVRETDVEPHEEENGQSEYRSGVH